MNLSKTLLVLAIIFLYISSLSDNPMIPMIIGFGFLGTYYGYKPA